MAGSSAVSIVSSGTLSLITPLLIVPKIVTSSSIWSLMVVSMVSMVLRTVARLAVSSEVQTGETVSVRISVTRATRVVVLRPRRVLCIAWREAVRQNH